MYNGERSLRKLKSEGTILPTLHPYPILCCSYTQGFREAAGGRGWRWHHQLVRNAPESVYLNLHMSYADPCPCFILQQSQRLMFQALCCVLRMRQLVESCSAFTEFRPAWGEIGKEKITRPCEMEETQSMAWPPDSSCGMGQEGPRGNAE